MWYIFDSLLEALAYNDKVCARSNFAEGVKWGTPRKHPTENRWAMIASSRVILDEMVPVDLSEDWIPNIDEL